MFLCGIIHTHYGPGVGVTKAQFVNFSILGTILIFQNYNMISFESDSYLTDVTAAQLRRHLPNINLIPVKYEHYIQ